MNLLLNEKRVLITGASKGIGYATALSFAREGALPVMVARNLEMLEKAASNIMDETGVNPELICLDLTSSGSAVTLFEAVGPVDILVNNAGSIPGGNLSQVDEARWRAAWELKVYGYINLTRMWLPSMSERGSGVIANVIGMAGVAHRNAYVCGTAANAALIAFTNAVGSNSSHQGVRVFGVNPGQTRTERMINLEKNTPGALSSGVAFGRTMEPTEVADFIVFGCSAKASYLSGTVINLDGGQQYADLRK